MSIAELVPDRLDVERIAADQQLAEPLRDRVRRRHLDDRPRDDRRGVALADAVEPLVGLDADEEGVLGAVGPQLDLGKAQDDGLDAGDAHGILSGERRRQSRESRAEVRDTPCGGSALPAPGMMSGAGR
jgi:hypothetical protein